MDKKILVLASAILILLPVAAGLFLLVGRYGEKEPVKVGILHSLTGTMAISEGAVADATLMAIEEINGRGGVLGRRIEPVLVDGRSDRFEFARQAEILIGQEKVSAVFGCWTSAGRKTVRPIFEKYNHLLVYPVQYEGLEASPNIIYTGAATNQQIIPAVKWSFDNLGKRFFLVSSDYVFPRAANAVIKDQAMTIGAEIVGEAYLLLGSDDVDEIIERIVAADPEVIFNTLNGESNIAFFGGLERAGITADRIPAVSFSIAENELATLGGAKMVGHYACWNYFQTVDTPENRNFVERFKKRYGPGRVTSDPMEAGYFGVYLWAQAVEEAGSTEPPKVRKALKGQSFLAPGGMVYIDENSNHTWKTVRIGRIRSDGQFDIVWSSGKPVQPVPYPTYRLRSEWDRFLADLYAGWAGNWENPGILMDVIEKRAKDGLALIQSLADSPVIVSAAVAANMKRPMGHQEILASDRRWKRLDEKDDFIRQFLENESAGRLKTFIAANRRFDEIFVADLAGLVVAMTNKTSDYYQADEKWWKRSCIDGSSGYEKIQFDRSANRWGIPIHAPIRDANGDTVGAIKAFIDITAFLQKDVRRDDEKENRSQ